MVAFIVLALVNAGKITAGEDRPKNRNQWGSVLLGWAIVLAYRNRQKRPKPGQTVDTPKWMATLDSVKPGAAVGSGALLSGVNPKNLLLNVSAALTIAGASLDSTSQIIVTIVFVLLSSLVIIGLVVYVQIAGKSAETKLNELKAWLIQNNATIMSVLLLVIGVKILGGMGLHYSRD